MKYTITFNITGADKKDILDRIDSNIHDLVCEEIGLPNNILITDKATIKLIKASANDVYDGVVKSAIKEIKSDTEMYDVVCNVAFEHTAVLNAAHKISRKRAVRATVADTIYDIKLKDAQDAAERVGMKLVKA